MDLSSDPEDLTGLSESVRVNSTSVMGKGLGGGQRGSIWRTSGGGGFFHNHG